MTSVSKQQSIAIGVSSQPNGQYPADRQTDDKYKHSDQKHNVVGKNFTSDSFFHNKE